MEGSPDQTRSSPPPHPTTPLKKKRKPHLPLLAHALPFLRSSSPLPSHHLASVTSTLVSTALLPPLSYLLLPFPLSIIHFLRPPPPTLSPVACADGSATVALTLLRRRPCDSPAASIAHQGSPFPQLRRRGALPLLPRHPSHHHRQSGRLPNHPSRPRRSKFLLNTKS